MIILLFILLIFYVIVDNQITRYHRNKIKCVIHVSGTRGKSSIVRMLDAVFREHGYRTFSKITGTNPVFRDVSGDELKFWRWIPNVIEQKRLLRMAAMECAEVLIVECMALTSVSQRHSEEILRADLLVISNVRTDHLEVMGHSIQEIAETLFCASNNNQRIITSDAKLYQFFKSHFHMLELAKKYNSIDGEYCDNTNLVFEICNILGLNLKLAKKAIMNGSKDVGITKMIDFKGNQILCGFAINDLESTEMLYKQYKANRKSIIMLNDRFDRPMRSRIFLEWMLIKNPDVILLEGDQIKKNQRVLIKSGFKGEILKLDELNCKDEVIFGIGNFKGIQKRLGIN